MAHATLVKAARKDYPEHGIKKGESYYWWSFRNPRGGSGGKYFSKTAPKPSQLTKSEFKSGLYAVEESLDDLSSTGYDSVESIQADFDSLKEELESLKSDTEDKLSNMPEGLQQGDTGQLLQSRIDELDSLIGEFEGLDFSEPEDEDLKPQGKETKKDAATRAIESRIEELIEEVRGFGWSID